MSEFLNLAFELISQIIYYLTEWVVGFFTGFLKIFVTGIPVYATIFMSYFPSLNLFSKVLAVLLVLILIAIPVLLVIILVRKLILYIRLKDTKEDNVELYKEIGRLNRQVLNLMDEKNKILALKVNNTGLNRVSYVGSSGLMDDVPVSAVQNVETNGEGGTVMAGTANVGFNMNEDSVANLAGGMAAAQVAAKKKSEEAEKKLAVRFPKLDLVDRKYMHYVEPVFDNDITLEQFCEGYRAYACSQLHLYYTIEVVRRFVAGMASSHLMILEGISGTGKTSLPYSFSRYLANPATLVSVQPNFRDRSELLGYFNEFSKKFNETEFLRALYEADYREEPCIIVLDEMNLARIEYYFAEMLSVLEMPSEDEWIIDLVPTGWEGDPVRMTDGKIRIPSNIWFVGTANNDDSTFTITDKVYDRAMPIELNERAAAFESVEQPAVHVTADHLKQMFADAQEKYPMSEGMQEKLNKLDSYLQTRFKLAIGNRIIKQMNDFVPVYVATGGTEADAIDYILSRKVLKKFESLNLSFVRDEIKGLIAYIEKVFGKSAMKDSRDYLTRIQNLY